MKAKLIELHAKYLPQYFYQFWYPRCWTIPEQFNQSLKIKTNLSCACSDVRHILKIDEISDVNNSTRTTTNACDYKNMISYATRVGTRELIAMFELVSHVCKVACHFFRALSTYFWKKPLVLEVHLRKLSYQRRKYSKSTGWHEALQQRTQSKQDDMKLCNSKLFILIAWHL